MLRRRPLCVDFGPFSGRRHVARGAGCRPPLSPSYRRRLNIIALLCVLSFPVAARAELIGHWAFDTVDTSTQTTPNTGSGGRALAGKLIGDAKIEKNVSDGTTTRPSVLSLDGKGDWGRIDHGVTTFGTGQSFTIAAWIKTDAAKMALLGKDDANGQLDPGDKIFFIKEGHAGR